MANQKYIRITGDDEVSRIIRNELTDQFCTEYVLFGEEETCLPERHLQHAETIRNFKVRDSDVILTGYPKCGTTWAQETIWLIVNDLDYKAADTPLTSRSPVIEYDHLKVPSIYDWKLLSETIGIPSAEYQARPTEYLNKQEGVRCYKTHLPYYLLPEEIQTGAKSPKIIYIMRDPKDVCVSYSHHGRIFHGWKASLENFSKVYLAGKVMYGSYWKHVLGYWKHRNSPNLLLIQYEEMKQDMPAVISKIAKFVGKEYTEEQINGLVNRTSFENMQKNKQVNAEGFLKKRRQANLLNEESAFIRSGTVGKYKEEMPPELIEKFNKWIQDNTEGTDFDRY